MKKEFEARSGQVVAFETYASGEKDLSAQWKKIAEAAPDVVFLPSYYGEVAEQLKQARAAGVKAPFLGSDNWGNPELLKSARRRRGGVLLRPLQPRRHGGQGRHLPRRVREAVRQGGAGRRRRPDVRHDAAS